jgi:hypothetical protein
LELAIVLTHYCACSLDAGKAWFRWALLAVFWLLTTGCNIHSSDGHMAAQFYRHRGEFESLFSMMQEDNQIISILPTFIVAKKTTVKNAPDNASVIKNAAAICLPVERLIEYRNLLSALSPEASVLRGDIGAVVFRLEGNGLLPLSTKGIIYSTNPLDSCPSDLASCMRRHELGHESQATVVYKMIEPHWYLYLSGE